MIPSFGSKKNNVNEIPSDAKEISITVFGEYSSPFRSKSKVQEEVTKAGFKVKQMYETPRDTSEKKFLETEFLVHGRAKKDEQEYFIIQCSGFDECENLTVHVSKEQKQAISNKFEPENSGRFTMSRSPMPQVGLFFIPTTYTTLKGPDGKIEHKLV
mmetsp:Transcript_13670/g.22931  ORF Transcript_13670/g.22931 Transcript_13670/m.22931 type:complete len:157 (+) Transcript_13670:55-525(+)